ncbi:Protein of unknown function DUF761 [Macleaya cordata]|uniref:DUF4408 domain-containing protein n=1 Tax=Macleaya cordata TaxID=56857 RepID=A0A200QTW5_MACCD|nr:Protein of unknown function DUF761 [Macleaya cordata]
MAVISRSSNNWILSLKVLLLSTGVLSTAMILKLSVPVVLEFMISGVPLFWRSLLSWLTPPYLYVVINGIIITIAASSRFHHKIEEQQFEPSVPAKITSDHQRPDFAISSEYDALLKNPMESVRSEFGGIGGYASPIKIPMEVRSEFGGVVGYDEVQIKNPVVTRMEFEDLKPKVYEQKEATVSEKKSDRMAATGDEDDGFVISRSTWTPSRTDSMEIPTDYSFFSEKPPASARFNHRKTVKASPEGGKALGVTKPKRHDTLENTWKTITDGRHMPLTRHLKKSDTWETHGRHHHSVPQEPSSPAAKLMKKSETFKERNNNQSSASPSPGSGKLRKEPSLSQDDLNRRVEAFIKKFNEEMRLQRQESLNQYREMVSRGTH